VMVNEALKAILALGYRIEKRGPMAEFTASSASSPLPAPIHWKHVPTNDMDDLEELDIYQNHLECQPLHAALSLLQNSIYQAFSDWDDEAIRYQWLYQLTSVLAVVFGSLTILVAIFEFILERGTPQPLTNIEALIAGATLLVIGIGTIGKFKEKWLEARYKAENLRLLKFKKLADPRLWCQPIDQDSLAEDLNEDVREVGAQNYDAVKTWASQGAAPAICESPRAVGCEAALHELIEYYRQKRLHVQMNYLERKSSSDEDTGSRTAIVVQFIFFASFAFVLAHIIVVLADGKTGINSAFEKWMIGCAAALPIIAAGVRVGRASREFERNARRHRATLDSLQKLEKELRDTNSLAEKFRIVGFCELVLEQDCREFMRLLCEVEWYG
jgi:hypothetical protein